MDNSFSSRLLHVSLFQGFSRLDFLDLVEKTPFDFCTIQHGKPVVVQHEECQSLCILMGGEVVIETESSDHQCRLDEYMKAPWVILPECLFGLHNNYSHTVRAVSDVQAVSLSKQSVRQLLMTQPTFQINFYNMLSTIAQNAGRQLWNELSPDLTKRFAQYVQARCLRPVGRKDLHVRMEDLAVQLDTTRLRVSRLLAELAERRLLTYSRGNISILALEHLAAYSFNHSRSHK